MGKRRLRRRQAIPQKRPGSWLGAVENVAKAAKYGADVVGHIKSWKNAATQATGKTTKNRGTQTKKVVQVKPQPGGIITHSYHRPKMHHSKVNKVYKVLANLCKYETLVPGQLMTADDSTNHRQASATVDHIWNGTDYGALVNQAYDNLVATNPMYQKHPATGELGQKVLLESCESIIEMTNMTEGSVMCWLYVLVANTTGTFEDPLTTWATAIESDKGSVSGTTGTRNFPFTTPDQNLQFRKTWKIEKKVMVHLTPGQTHKHKSIFNLGRLTDYDYWSKFTMVKGITRTHMLTGRGQLGDNTLGVKGTQTLTFAPIKIDMCIHHLYKTRILNTFPANTYYLNSLTSLTYDEDVTTDHLYINNPVTGGVTDTHDTSTIA